MPESWKKSLQSAFLNHRIISAINQDMQVNWLMLDLGIAEVALNQLNEELDRMLIAFNRLCKYKQVTQVSLGCFRMLDIIRNKERCQPKLHVLLPTIKSYFQGRYYIKAESWLSLWCRALDTESVEHVTVNVKVVNTKGDQQAIVRKMDEGLSRVAANRGQRRIGSNEPSIQLPSRRLIGYSRVMKEYLEKLRPDPIYDLNEYRTEDSVANAAFEMMLDWYPGIRLNYDHHPE
ncbi:replication protein [Paenibacillus sp. E194]|uniref:protein rep n=1 Tax=Paenibacillus sp. E194 TaxID=1458845 RepID=UPI0005CAE94F|nr:protein rep [Paenibacillus sp. E194]KJB86982.1 replication protein [Paenibacillus sp. E194]